MSNDTTGLVLVADDDPAFAKAFAQMLQLHGHETMVAASRAGVLDALRGQTFDLLTLDLDWEQQKYNGIDILRDVQHIDPLLPVVMITGHASIPTAVEATRLGAFDYVEKIIEREKVLVTIKNAIETGRLKRQNQAFLRELRSRYEIIGHSVPIRGLENHIRRVGPTDSVVLITGESGTGKELVARQIHYHSRRSEYAFVSIDSGTLADSLAESELFGHRKGAFTGAVQDRPGLIAQAEGGTLFLDEIANASSAIQAKLLHLLQAREYRRVGEDRPRPANVRIIAATNQPLPDLVARDRFRGDLYYRLKVIELELPPLRDRKEDIPVLLDHFFSQKSRQCQRREKRLASDAMLLLMGHSWPGNVRELENTIERLVVLSDNDEITAAEARTIAGIGHDHPSELRSLQDMTRDFKRECLIKALALAAGNISKAADLLQIDRTHLHRLIREFQIASSQE